MGRLDGKIALITGTGGGQGRAASLMFAKEGARIIGCDVKVQGSQETERLVRAAGGEMVATAPIDLSKSDEVKKWVDDAAAVWGGLDIVYNNASAQHFAPVTDMTPDLWRFTMANDLDLVFYVCHYSWPHLVARGGGSIICISSVSGIRGNMNRETVGHSTAKAGVIGMAMQLAAEGARHKIRVNVISPGIVATEIIADYLKTDAGRTMVEQIPWGRAASAEEIVATALFLASDESLYVTGANIVVDGGLTAVY